MQYFEHDAASAADQKIVSLRVGCGGAGVDAFWYLVEQMHKDERGICVSDARAMRSHCHTLCVDENTLTTLVEEMVSIGLLYIDNEGLLWSARAQKNIENYKEKKRKATSSANARWGNADGMRPHNKRNANAMLTKQNKTKVSTTKSSTKPIASGDAAMADATPPSAGLPHCPDCDALMAFDVRGGFWRCRDSDCKATMKPADIDKGTPHCPLCKSVAKEVSGKWQCQLCGDIKAPDFGGKND